LELIDLLKINLYNFIYKNDIDKSIKNFWITSIPIEGWGRGGPVEPEKLTYRSIDNMLRY